MPSGPVFQNVLSELTLFEVKVRHIRVGIIEDNLQFVMNPYICNYYS